MEKLLRQECEAFCLEGSILLMNDINHPNNYGHKLYAAAFSAIL